MQITFEAGPQFRRLLEQIRDRITIDLGTVQDLTDSIKAQTEAISNLTAIVGQVINPDLKDATMHVIRIKDSSAGLIVEGRIDTMQITDTQETVLTFGKPKDKKGFDTAIQGDPVFAASDDAVTLAPVDGDPYSIKVSGAHPSALGADGVTPVAGTVTISGDADLGDGVETITGSEPYIVTAGKAAGFGAATQGAVTEQA